MTSADASHDDIKDFKHFDVILYLFKIKSSNGVM